MKNSLLKIAFLITCLVPLAEAQTPEIPNPLIDSPKFRLEVAESQKLRDTRRVTEEQFLEMSKDPKTIILDARSPLRFSQMHVKGAKPLNFADFTESSLSNVIASKDTRILIYCNNNIKNSEVAFAVAFATKARSAALNLSTFTSLYSYGYKNVYELGPVIDPASSKIEFEGSMAPKRK